MRQIARLRDERRAIFRKKSYLLCVHDLPVAEFAKQFVITEIMPELCNVYYKPMELSRAKFIAKFIRKEICEDGNKCDYTICGDKYEYVFAHPENTDEKGSGETDNFRRYSNVI